MIQRIVVGEFLVCMLKVYIQADSLLFANLFFEAIRRMLHEICLLVAAYANWQKYCVFNSFFYLIQFSGLCGFEG